MPVVLENQSLLNSLQIKYKELEENRIQMDLIEQNYIWNEFRPPLSNNTDIMREPATIDLADTNTKSMKSFENAVHMFKDRSLWISSKIVDGINNIISNQEIENIKYDPLPLGNSCCLSEINPNYTYYDFLNKNDISKNLQTYSTESRNMEYIGSKLYSSVNQMVRIEPSVYRIPLVSYKNFIFPTKKQIEKNSELVKNYFNNFVDAGYYRGIKRIYNEDNICTYTGKPLSTISSRAHSVEDFYNLLNKTHKINNPGVVPTIKPIVINDDLEQPKFNENTKFILKKIKKTLDHKVLRENEYINDLVEKELDKILEKDSSDKIKVWDILERTVKNCKDELLGKLGKNLDKNSIQTVKTIISNMESYDNLEIMDRKILEDVEGKLDENTLKEKLFEIKNKRLENQCIKYILNYLCKYVFLLSNQNPELDNILNIHNDNDIRLRKSQKTINDIKTKEFEKLNKFRNKNCRKLFKKVRPLLNGLNSIKNIRGNHNIRDYNTYNLKVLNYAHHSTFNSYNSYLLLKLIFFHLLSTIIDVSTKGKESSAKVRLSKKSISLSNDDDDDEINEFKHGTSESIILSNYVLTIFQLIEKERLFTNKYSQILAEKNIKTKNEENKDRNLHVMELLDLETRRLRNEMMKTGLKQYANLAKDFQEVINKEEQDNILKEQYKKSMGDAYTEDGFERFKENREHEMKLENEIGRDNEEYLDAEGDDEMEI